MSSKPRVYLAGPIGHLSYAEAVDWRTEAQAALKRLGIEGYSPMRSKEFLKTGAILPSQANVADHPLATSKGIMTRDHRDCCTADALLVNFHGVDRVSLGTAMELAWAYDRHIPTVVVAEPNNPNINHPMAHEAVKFRVDTMAEALTLIQTILLPEAANGQ